MNNLKVGKDIVAGIFFVGSVVLMFTGDIVLILVAAALFIVTLHYFLKKSVSYPFIKPAIGVFAVFLLGLAFFISMMEKGEHVEVSGVSFTAPEGWEVFKYPAEGILVEVIGPDEGNSNPYFGIERGYYEGSFEDGAESIKYAVSTIWGEVLAEGDTIVGGKDAIRYVYRFSVPDRDYYRKGKIVVVDVREGEIMGITFSSKEDTYNRNESVVDVMIDSIEFE